MNKLFFLLVSCGMLIVSCNKEKQESLPTKSYDYEGRVLMNFRNMVGNEKLMLDNHIYLNPNGDQFTASRLSYFISNIVLNGDNGSKYQEENSFHLLNEADESTMAIMLTNVPNGIYTSVTFLIGVDTFRCNKDMQNYLPGTNDMVFSKDEGYIMMNMEGHSPSSNQPDGNIRYHISGYRGPNEVLRTITLTFPGEMVVDDNSRSLHLKADLLKMFENPHLVDFRTMPIINGPGENARIMADNYSDMFSVSAVE